MTARFFQDWFEAWEPEPGVYVIQEPKHAENVKSYLVTGSERAVLIDTGMGAGDIRAVVEQLTMLPVSVLNSHSHWDHIGGNWQFDEIAIHRAEAGDLQTPPAAERIRGFFADQFLAQPFPETLNRAAIEIKPSRATQLLDGGERIELGGRTLEIVHAPGHSPGGIVIVDRANGLMFSTDVVYLTTLYAYGDHGDVAAYRETLRRLEPIAAEMRALFPSHDATPIDPGIVPQMRAAFDEIIAGRTPDEIAAGRATHRFGPFSVLMDAGEFEKGGVS